MKLLRILSLAGPLILAPALRADSNAVIPLWPNGAPGFENRKDIPEQAQDYWVRSINNPSVTVFLPPKEKANGAAVVIFPGGGHRELVFNAEGIDPARYFNALGVTAFVVKYRLGREEGSPYRVERDAALDGKRAMRLVRSRAAEWNLDPHRIGVMGFSAGGEMVSMIVYDPTDGDPRAPDPIDRVTSRPDFQVVIYPGPFRAPVVVPKSTPPAFFLGTVDDRGPCADDHRAPGRLRGRRRPGRGPPFSRGGHAFNMGYRSKLATLKKWPDRLTDWMADNGILDPNNIPKDEHH
jgi:acetyl esterase/lipase